MVHEIILVNERDERTGTAEKMEAHRNGWLHRAFSVFIFNNRGELLLQRRALNKYHSGGLWTNTCCSHPAPGEDTLLAAQRRLKEEMGFEAPLSKIFDFVYRAEFENGLTEHEFDHVYAGEFNGPVNFNKEEVSDYAYRSMSQIRETLEHEREIFTAWFVKAFPLVEAWWNKQYKMV